MFELSDFNTCSICGKNTNFDYNPPSGNHIGGDYDYPASCDYCEFEVYKIDFVFFIKYKKMDFKLEANENKTNTMNLFIKDEKVGELLMEDFWRDNNSLYNLFDNVIKNVEFL